MKIAVSGLRDAGVPLAHPSSYRYSVRGGHCIGVDLWADPGEPKRGYGLDPLTTIDRQATTDRYAALVPAVIHDAFTPPDPVGDDSTVLYDIKSFLDPERVDGGL